MKYYDKKREPDEKGYVIAGICFVSMFIVMFILIKLIW